jgi:hypothetical protein
VQNDNPDSILSNFGHTSGGLHWDGHLVVFPVHSINLHDKQERGDVYSIPMASQDGSSLYNLGPDSRPAWPVFLLGILMKSLTTKIRKLQDGPIGKIVRKRLGQFASFKNKPTEDWFSELCFCILTANSRGRTAFRIQQELGPKGFCLEPSEKCWLQRRRHN